MIIVSARIVKMYLGVCVSRWTGLAVGGPTILSCVFKQGVAYLADVVSCMNLCQCSYGSRYSPAALQGK